MKVLVVVFTVVELKLFVLKVVVKIVLGAFIQVVVVAVVVV